MKKIFAISLFILLSTTQSANAHQIENHLVESATDKKYILVSQKPEPLVDKELKHITNRQYYSHRTKSTQVLAILKTEPEKKEIPVAKPIQTSIANHKAVEERYTAQNFANLERKQPRFDRFAAQSQSHVKKDIQKKPSKRILTKGHYVGIDLVGNRVKISEEEYYQASGYREITPSKDPNYGGGIGINYKYAFNLNRFFLAPGVFYERGKNRAYVDNRNTYTLTEQLSSVEIKSRYGIFVHAGYDLTSHFSPYVLYGMSRVGYRSEVSLLRGPILQSAIVESSERSNIVGGGLKINYNDKISFNVEYNHQNFDTKNSFDFPINANVGAESTYVTKVDTLKVGASYNF